MVTRDVCGALYSDACGKASEIPIVNISAFITGEDLAARKDTARELAEKCRLHGCLGIVGHGIPSNVLEQAFSMVHDLFDLPLPAKLQAAHPEGPTPHRGYSALGAERDAMKGAQDEQDPLAREKLKTMLDYKESYEIGSEQNSDGNIWIREDDLPGFREASIKLYWRLNKTAMAVLEALIMSLELNEKEQNNIRSFHTGHDNQLRLLHYPPVTQSQSNDLRQSRLGLHQDWSSFTLLFQDSHGGLEFADRIAGGFMSAVPREDMLYMNIGDMFMRLSNGLYPAAAHRVILSDNDRESPRYSIPYFVSPRADGVVYPQSSGILAGLKPSFEPIVVQKYSEEMFEKIRT